MGYNRAEGMVHVNLKPALRKTVIGLVIACCVVAVPILLILWMADPLNLRAPNDRALIVLFHDHRMALERLRQMATEDLNVQGWRITASSLNEKLDDARKREYRHLLSEVQPLGMSVDYDGTVRFAYAGGGILAIGPEWGKGIEYVPGDYRKKGAIVQNLDRARKLPLGDVYLRQIEPHWFIFYQRD